jgi:hypothetical protein
MKRLFGILLLLSITTNALDIAVKRITCDASLPVSIANLSMTCSGHDSSSCTFGNTALLQGQLVYNGLSLVGLAENSTAYISGEFDVAVDYLHIPSGTQLDLCGDEWILSDSAECPQDGIYNFEVFFQLPSYGDCWWATGWRQVGSLDLFADFNSEELIGSCQVHYITQVTSESDIHAPSAFAIVFLVGSLGLLGLTWAVYYILRVYQRRARKRTDNNDVDDNCYYLTEHKTISKHARTLRTNDDEETIATLHTPPEEGRWKFGILRCGGFDFDERNEDHVDIPNVVSYDSGILAKRSQEDGTVELSRIMSTSSAENSSLSGDSSTAAASSESGNSTLYSGSSSSSAVSTISSVNDKYKIHPKLASTYKPKRDCSVSDDSQAKAKRFFDD